MSLLTSLSCAQAHEKLIELAFGELSPELSAAVRAHIGSCNKCQPAWEQMRQVLDVAAELPLVEPPDTLSDRVMEAARVALEKRASVLQKPPHTAASASTSTALSWWSRLSSWALSPQVAMASVLLLMVGMGLYALPLGRNATQLSLEAIPEEPSPGDPSPGDPRAASAARVPLEAKDAAESEAGPSRLEEGVGLPRPEASRTRSKEKSKPNPGVLGGAVRDARPAPADLARKTSAAHSAGRNEESAPLTAPAAPMKRAAPAAAYTLDEADLAKPESTRSESKQATLLADGMANAQRGAYAQAISQLVRVVNEGTPREQQIANLWLARSYRGQGNYARAVSYYELVLASNGVGNDVLAEAAESYERLGNMTRADELRARM